MPGTWSTPIGTGFFCRDYKLKRGAPPGFTVQTDLFFGVLSTGPHGHSLSQMSRHVTCQDSHCWKYPIKLEYLLPEGQTHGCLDMQETKAEAARVQMVKTQQENQQRLAARKLAKEQEMREQDRYSRIHTAAMVCVSNPVA